MNFLIGLMILITLVLGMNFCFLLVGGSPLQKGEEFSPVRVRGRKFSVERFAVGVSTSVLGVGWFITWAYFLVTGWDSFFAQWQQLWPHVALQLVASTGLTVAGFAIFAKWKRRKGLFLTSMGILVGSILMALMAYGPMGHGTPVFMYLIAAWTLVIGGVFTTGVYVLDWLVHERDKSFVSGKDEAVGFDLRKAR